MLLTQEDLDRIAAHRPQEKSEFSLLKAAVAIILRDTEQGTEFLLMQRAYHHNDPWSGQMAFPGGKIDSTDVSAQAAAVRETSEEVGIELAEQDYIGRLDDLYGLKVDNQYSVHVACFVFKPQQELRPIGNHEVADLVWLPFAWLEDVSNAHDYTHPHSGDLKMPAVLIDQSKDQILWGLSLRMVSMLYDTLGKKLPVLPEEHFVRLRQIEAKNFAAQTEKSIDGGTG